MKYPVKMNPNSNEMREYKRSRPPLTQFQKEVLVGLTLGDASLRRQNKDISVKFQVGDINKEYLDHFTSIFEGWILSPPHKLVRKPHPKTGNIYINWGSQTISHPEFNFLGELFFKLYAGKFIKGVNPSIKPYITNISLAYWYMDDGNKSDYRPNGTKGLTFNTQGFKEDEVELLVNIIKDNFNIDCWSKSNKNGRVICTSSYDYNKIFPLI